MPNRKSLPSKYIVKTGKFVWTTMWNAMMSQMAPRNRTGEYIRPESAFRSAIDPGENSPYPPQEGRYHLLVGMGCPWAHRTLVVRALKGLEDAIAVSVVSPSPDEGIWLFDTPEFGCRTLPEFYQQMHPGYTGRCTVPVLWDSQRREIVNNESAEIIVLLSDRVNEFARNPNLDLYPADLKAQIDRWNDKIYNTVNNGVYRCGFAQTQIAYDKACSELFATLDEIESTLEKSRYICGDRITLADVRLFTTLFRFDIVYYSLFKCNRRRIQDYPNLSGYLRDIYQLPGVAETCDLESVKRDYYGNLFPLNPGGIIPLGPDIDLNKPHDRDRLNG